MINFWSYKKEYKKYGISLLKKICKNLKNILQKKM